MISMKDGKVAYHSAMTPGRFDFASEFDHLRSGDVCATRDILVVGKCSRAACGETADLWHES